MKAKKKQHGILIHMPVPPYNNMEEMITRSYPPIVSGYLKALARQRGLLEHFHLQIWDERMTSCTGDIDLALRICQAKPLFAAFGCFCWNLSRVLTVAAEIKKHDPGIIIILGGPEISEDNSFLFSRDTVFDYLVIGEGEVPFCDLLEYLSAKRKTLSGITGLSFREKGKWVQAERAITPGDLVASLSPYLGGDIELENLRSFPIETVRGCPFRCGYCHYGISPLRPRPIDLIIEEFKLARKYNIPEVYILAPTFNLTQDFHKICQRIAEINYDKKQQVFVELRADFLKPEDIEMLKSCHVVEAGIGLQSISPAVSGNIERPFKKENFSRGLHMLVNAGIRVLTDIIIGLPGESLDTARETAHFLAATQLPMRVLCYWLCILPDTELKRKAETYGMSYSENPPYYVTSTQWMSTEEIAEGVSYAQKTFGYTRNIKKYINLPLLYDTPSIPPTPVTSLPTSWNRLTIDLDNLAPGPDLIPREIEERAGICVLLWLRAADLSKYKDVICQLGDQLTQKHPNIIWDLVFDSDRPFTNSWLMSTAAHFRSQVHYLNHPMVGNGIPLYRFGGSVHCFVLAKWHSYAALQWQSKELQENSYFLWQVKIGNNLLPPGLYHTLVHDDFCDGVVVETGMDINSPLGQQLLEQLTSLYMTGKTVRFLDREQQQKWHSLYGYLFPGIPNGKYDQHISIPGF